MPDSSDAHICATCSKSYKRREHLQRHTLTHRATRPYSCNICNAAFSRTDVLRRHSQRCSGAKPQSASSSRRSRACDRCVHQKKACSLGQPCRNCELKDAPCCYSQYTGDDSHNELTWNAGIVEGITNFSITQQLRENGAVRSAIISGDGFEAHGLAQDLDDFLQGTFPDLRSTGTGNDTLDWLNFLGVPEQNSNTKESYHVEAVDGGLHFQFLYNFTSRTGLGLTFECGSPAQRQQVLEVLTPTDGGLHRTANDSHETANDGQAFKSSWLFDPLIVKVHEIVNRLKEIVTSRRLKSASIGLWTTETEQECVNFFSPSNIHSLLASYWALWHPNVNFVHKPTFDPAKSKPCLIAAMVVIGKLYPSPRCYAMI